MEMIDNCLKFRYSYPSHTNHCDEEKRSMPHSYGELNGALIGATMRDCVVRATRLIRDKRFTFKPKQKGVKADGRPDWVTDADEDAQEIYTKVLRERFPQFGIVGEEEGLRIECTHPTDDFWFSVDPLDGTSAYNRYQSHGIGTMIALMHGKKVIAVAIGDILTGEIYYYRPDSRKTHRLDVHQNTFDQRLWINPKRTLREQYILLRDPVEKHMDAAKHLVQLQPHPLFYSHEITGGSIGISMARLWKGEVGAAILRPGKQTPWDSCPVLGITKRLGFVFFDLNPLGITPDAPTLRQAHPIPQKNIYTTNVDTLVIHKSRINELTEWCARASLTITL